MPLLPALIALVLPLTGPDPRALRCALAVLTSVTVPALYALATTLLRDRAAGGLAAGAFLASSNGHRLATALMAEPLAGALLTTALVVSVHAERARSRWLPPLAGLLLGLAVLGRAFLLPVVAGPVLWLCARSERRKGAIVALTTALVIGPWIVRNARSVGTFGLTTETDAVWQGNNVWARGSWPGHWDPQERYLLSRHPDFLTTSEAGRSRIYLREAWSDVTGEPGRVLGLLPRKAAIFLSPVSYLGWDWAYLAALPFFVAGTLTVARRREMRPLLWVAAVPILGILAVCLIAFGDPRFRHPVDPLIFLLAAAVPRAWR
jgi:hypothetical protein